MDIKDLTFTAYVDNYLTNLKQVIDKLDRQEINLFIQILANAYQEGRQIFIMGNGGSASTASHFACDINKGVSLGLEKRFKVICLNDCIPTMLAYANDTSYADVFVEQLRNMIDEDDIVIGISGSGNSPNVIRAIEYANLKNAMTVGITGYGGGKLKEISKHSVNASVDDMQYSEDVHIILTHIAMKALYNILRK
jgi:D-sedoheptulose 7-phosphate isomerase